LAAAKGHKETCEVIIVKSKRIKISRDNYQQNQFEAIKMALQPDRTGFTALHKAVANEHSEIVKLLVWGRKCYF
jgi:ankyrin repeat protein